MELTSKGKVLLTYQKEGGLKETLQGTWKKKTISWRSSVASYEGKLIGSNPQYPDEITGTYQNKSGGGSFKYVLSFSVEDPNLGSVPVRINNNIQTKKEIILGQARDGPLFQQILQKCKASGNKWTDPDFPANNDSLGNIKVNGQSPVWRRSSEIFKSPKLFSDGISPHDIKQGALGDCYFLAALSVLAEHPQFITNLFTCHDNDCGVYSVTFYPMGIKTEVVVDDLLPCIGNSPCFSKTFEEELWVLLVEKAYAKCYGSYKNIASGYAHQAVFDLMGCYFQTFVLEPSNVNQVFDKLVLADTAKHMMLGMTPGKDSGKFQTENTGLCAGHAYGILDARNFHGHQLVHLRNPWGRVEWTGAWGDKDSRWTPEAKQALNWSDADDGTYWMSLQDVAKYFRNVSISYTGISTLKYSTGLTVSSGCSKTVVAKVSGSGNMRVSFCQGRVTSDSTLASRVLIKSGGRFLTEQNPDFEYTYNYFTTEVPVSSGDYQILVEIWNEKKPNSEGYLNVLVTNDITVQLTGGDFQSFKYPRAGPIGYDGKGKTEKK
eukprot:TRINITY_DN10979_c0_g1_i2.p1 TRINITY_DN10979_c0_g1~~TRINITY_DN10979_c0_g1_i2.p1  ORF type:complete len:547 (+),score=113.39 TRINITY_DN10979_c0_g1_i2:691-2331(+)